MGNDTHETVAAKLRAARVPESIIREVAEHLTTKPYEATPGLAVVLFDDERAFRFAVADWLREASTDFLFAVRPDHGRPWAAVRIARRTGENTATAQEWIPPQSEEGPTLFPRREPVAQWPEGFFRSVAAVIRHQPERAASLGWQRPFAAQPLFA
ncbi:MAG: hypothetical protein INF50_09505 [Rhodobacter sp.]|nr:hypothetical protein [Rhodobacter sp.]